MLGVATIDGDVGVVGGQQVERRVPGSLSRRNTRSAGCSARRCSRARGTTTAAAEENAAKRSVPPTAPARWAARSARACSHCGGEGLAVLEQRVGGGREPHVASDRLEERDVELAREGLHLVRDGRRRQPAHLRGGGDRAVARDRLEHAQTPIDHVRSVQDHRFDDSMDADESGR